MFKFITDNPGFYSILTFFLGLILGHWLALGRDKRKEFNEAASDIYGKVYDYLKTNSKHHLPTLKELELFAKFIPIYRRKKYLNLVSLYGEGLVKDKEAYYFDTDKAETVIRDGYVSELRNNINRLAPYFNVHK